MPNIKSKKKRAITNLKAKEAHKSEKSALKTSVKAVAAAIAANDKAAAVAALSVANSKLDSSITSGIHHKNYVARQKARLAKAVNALD